MSDRDSVSRTARDLNNELNAILGVAELALTDARDPALRSDLRAISDAAMRSAVLVRKLQVEARAS